MGDLIRKRENGRGEESISQKGVTPLVLILTPAVLGSPCSAISARRDSQKTCKHLV